MPSRRRYQYYAAAAQVMGMNRGTEMAHPVKPEYQDISGSDSDEDVHMYSGTILQEPRSMYPDSASSSGGDSPLTPSFFFPAPIFNGRSPESTRPSVIVASSKLDTNHGSPSSGQTLPPPPPSPTCEIITQPKPLMRFRYTSEYKDNRAAHKMVGQDSTAERTTHPSILIKGWDGPAVITVSLVQDDKCELLHPHSLVLADRDKDTEQEGFVRRRVNCSSAGSGTHIQFNDLCLIRNKKEKESVGKRLEQRYMKINPFGVVYKPSDTSAINLHAVRLCFEVRCMDERPGYYRDIRLPPVVSNVVRNSGAHQTLKIIKLSFCPKTENLMQEVILICDKVDKDDTEVEVVTKFESGKEVLLHHTRDIEVYGQVAIIFKMSHFPHAAGDIDNTYVRLKRISTQDTSELYKFTPPRPLEYVAGTPTPPSPPRPSPGVPSTSPGQTRTQDPPAIVTFHTTYRAPIRGNNAPYDLQEPVPTNSIRPKKNPQLKNMPPKESPKDTLNDIQLNNLTIDVNYQATGHASFANSTKVTTHTHRFNGFTFLKNDENLNMGSGSNQSPFLRDVFTEDVTPAAAEAASNIAIDLTDDDNANGCTEEMPISDIISSGTMKVASEGLRGVDKKTEIEFYSVFDHTMALPDFGEPIVNSFTKLLDHDHDHTNDDVINMST